MSAPDKELNEVMQLLMGYALIENTKHDPTLNAAAKKKVYAEMEKTELYQKHVVRPSKEN